MNKERLNSLAIKASQGDEKSREEIYVLLNGEMQNYAQICAMKYQKLGVEACDFAYTFFLATDRALVIYELERGDFLYYWRSVLKTEAFRFISAYVRSNRMKERNNYRYDVVEPWQQDVIFNSYQTDEMDYDTIDKTNKILDFVSQKYDEFDKNLLLEWMRGKSFIELAKGTKYTPKQISSRVYNVLEAIKRHFVLDINI